MKMRKTAILTAAAVLLSGSVLMSGCGQKEVFNTETMTANQFLITLYPEYAPISCENFETLVNNGFYDGLIFHRVMDDFMAQGGDPTGTGMGGSEKTITGEFAANGVQNTLSHTRGVVSMARSGDPNSASSQFFICYSDSDTFLDGNYAAFGKVTAGMEVVDDFLKVERTMSSSGEISVPVTPITIDTAVVVAGDEEGHPQVLFTMQDFLPAADAQVQDIIEETVPEDAETAPAEEVEETPLDDAPVEDAPVEDAPAEDFEEAPAEAE